MKIFGIPKKSLDSKICLPKIFFHSDPYGLFIFFGVFQASVGVDDRSILSSISDKTKLSFGTENILDVGGSVRDLTMGPNQQIYVLYHMGQTHKHKKNNKSQNLWNIL